MPVLMSLEGPQLSRLDEIRGQLAQATPKPILRASVQFQGLVDPWKAHPWVFVLGLVGGIFLAGTTMGRGLVSKYGPKKKR